jgi:hypothetical protein
MGTAQRSGRLASTTPRDQRPWLAMVTTIRGFSSHTASKPQSRTSPSGMNANPLA